MKPIKSIIITKPEKEKLFDFLLRNRNEENMAVTFCGHNSFGKTLQLLVKDSQCIGDSGLSQHSAVGLELKKEAYRKILLASERTHTSLLFWHSHPFTDTAWFSGTDDQNDLMNAEFISKHLPHAYYGNVVVAQKSHKARLYNKKKKDFEDIPELVIIGQPGSNGASTESPTLERNYRAFGKQGQAVISGMKVVMVGCGGLGWQVVLQLVALGVRKLLLIDPDSLEITNMNRMPGAPFSKVGEPKVKVLAEISKQMNPKLDVRYEVASVFEKRIQEKMKRYDVIIAGLDFQRPRSELNRFAVKYVKYYLDAGSEIILENGKVKHAGGQINLVIPGVGPCLACNNTLDWKSILYEGMDKREQEFEVKRGYIRGVSEPSASVVSINGVVASSLVNEFLALATGLKEPAYYTYFDYMSKGSLMFTIDAKRNEKCIICGRDSLLACGDIENREEDPKELPAFIKEVDHDEGAIAGAAEQDES